MRADYALYVAAVVCFIVAALPYMNIISEELLKPDSFPSIATTVVFAALGLISVILGFSMRPKPVISIPETMKTPPPRSPNALPPTEETTVTPPSAPTPSTLSRKEIVESKEKKTKARTKRKRTRRPRKKT